MGNRRGASSRPAARPTSPPPRVAPPPRAPAPAAAHPPARAAAPAPAAHPPAHAPAAAHPPAHPPAQAPGYQGPGMMGTIVGSAAGGIAGSVIGHGIANTMFGGRDNHDSAPAAAAAPAAPATGTTNNFGAQEQGACASFYKQFTDCLSTNNNNISECQFQFDQFQSCKRGGVKGDTYVYLHSVRRDVRSNSASAVTPPTFRSPSLHSLSSPRKRDSLSSPLSASLSDSLGSSSPSYHATTPESFTHSAPSSPSSFRRSASARKSLNLSSLSSLSSAILSRSPTHKSTSIPNPTSLILSIQIPVLGRKKKINFNPSESVQDALKLIQEKFELGEEMQTYELFIAGRAKYCKRDRLLSAYKLKDLEELVLKERRSFVTLRGKKDDKEDNSHIVRVALPISFTRTGSGKPPLMRHLPTSASVSASASPLSSRNSSPSHSPKLPHSSALSHSPSTSITPSPSPSPGASPGGSPLTRQRSLSGSSTSLSLMSVGRALSRSNLAKMNKKSWQVCDYGHTSHDIMKKVEEKYTQVERDILEDFGLYKDGVWLDKRKTLDWYKISSNDVLVFKPMWIRLELELADRLVAIKVLPNFTVRAVKNHIKRFSQASAATPKLTTPPTSSRPPAFPTPSRYTASSTSSRLASPALTPLHSPSLPSTPSTPSASDQKATWDFTSEKYILEVQPIDLDGDELPVDGFTLEQTREYLAIYRKFQLFLMPSFSPAESTAIGMLLEDDRELSSYRLQRGMRLCFRKHDEFTKRHFKPPLPPEPGRLVRSNSPTHPLAPLAALSGYFDGRIYVVVNSLEHRICQLFDFDKEVVIRHVIETFLQAAQTKTGIKENPDRYSVYLNTNELVGDSDPDTSNMVLLDSSKNLSLYPLKDMDRLELRRNISVLGISPSEFELQDDNGLTVPYFLITLKLELLSFGLEKEGIFRVAGSDATLTKLSREFFFNTYMGCEDIYSVAAFIKRWYMRLPEKLLAPLSLSELDSLSVEPAQKIREYINVRLTDKLKRDLFWWLIRVGAGVTEKVEHNKMNAKNIAIVFGPLIYETDVLHMHQKMIMIVQTLVEDQASSSPSLFSTPASLLRSRSSPRSRFF